MKIIHFRQNSIFPPHPGRKGEMSREQKPIFDLIALGTLNASNVLDWIDYARDVYSCDKMFGISDSLGYDIEFSIEYGRKPVKRKPKEVLA